MKDLQNPIPNPPQRTYQLEAVHRVLETLATHDRAHVVMACGTGKTRVALRVAEGLDATRVVVFVPSLTLISQLMQEWLMATVWPQVDYLAVCSDKTTAKHLDEFAPEGAICQFPVTTNPETIRAFLGKTTDAIQIVFCTYQSAAALAEAVQGIQALELGIFDEAHRTTSHGQFSLALNDEQLFIKKRLFMTATPRHYDAQRKNKEGESKLIYSMDNEHLYGPRAYTFSFRKAIEERVILDYKILVPIVRSEDILTITSDREQKAAALRKAIERIPSISKIISFHKNIREAHLFATHLQQNPLKNLKSLHVSSLLPTRERKQVLDDFRKYPSIITNARCLTEGIDVPAVDMVAFLDKKNSPIDIVQAIGRAVRKSAGKTTGYIFLPLFLEEGDSPENAALKAGFDKILEVVQALSEQDESLWTTLRTLRQEEGRLERWGTALEQYVEFMDLNPISEVLQKQFQEKISILVVEKLVEPWHHLFGRLQAFKDIHGHVNVPRHYTPDLGLSTWVNTQRNRYAQNLLGEEKIALLESLGFEWSLLDFKWEASFQKFCIFKERHGPSYVSRLHKEDKILAVWLWRQIRLYGRGKLSSERIRRLESAGLKPPQKEFRWLSSFKKLRDFWTTEGHSHIPDQYPPNQALANWVRAQRMAYRKGELSNERIALLDSLHFEWRPIETNWQALFERLKRFQSDHQSTKIPSSHSDRALRNWIQTQRVLYRRNQLSPSKTEILRSIGFVFEPHQTAWENSLEKLKQYKEEHRHTNVPLNYPPEPQLGIWVQSQREAHKRRKLTQQRFDSLNTLGFEWRHKKSLSRTEAGGGSQGGVNLRNTGPV